MTSGGAEDRVDLDQLTPAQRVLLARRLRERAALRVQAEEADAAPTLSFAQERMWLLGELTPGMSAYNTFRVARLRGRVDQARLREALSGVMRDHEVLRTRVRRGPDGDPLAFVAEPSPAQLDVVRAGDEDGARRAVEGFISRPFDLEADEMLRALLVEVDDVSWLALSLHHIASDEASRAVLWDNLDARYSGREAQQPPFSYSHFARQQRKEMAGSALSDELAWWREHLRGAPPTLDLPLDHVRPAIHTYRGHRLSVPMDEALVADLRAFARENSTTFFVTVLSAFSWLLRLWTREEDLLIGMPVSGRDHPGVAGLIGLFGNTVVVRSGCAGEPTFAELVDRTRVSVLSSLAHQRVPFEKVVETIAPVRDLSRNPLFQVAVNAVTSERDDTFMLGDLAAESVALDPETTKVDVGLLVRERLDGGSELVFEWSVDLFEDATIEALAAELLTLLRAAMDAPDRPLPELDVTPAEQRTTLVETVNATQAPIPDGCLHDAMATQAVRTPDAVAVADDNGSLTYAELDRRANAMAHHLRELGVGPGVLVGVGVPRSVAMEVAVIATLKAGGAYVPLDTTYPATRLSFMLEDSKAAVLLTDRATRAALPHHDVTVLMDDLDDIVASQPSTAPETGVTPDDLCYVIYTSGSTGRPKGAELRHRGLVNRLDWMQRTFELTGADTVLQKTPLSFDVSAWEVLWPVMVGARLFLARPDGQRDPAYLAEVIETEQVTIAHFVPSMLAAFLGSGAADPLTESRLRAVVCSGEALSFELKEQFFAALPGVELHNLYGPTEASIDVTWHECRPGLAHRVRIGGPITNVETFVLDAQQRPVPIGVPGELYLAGVQLARGYLGRPELTAERFVPLELAADGRAYRTGDLVRWTSQGEIDYLGRLDDQVKLRGFRIELGEIESVLGSHPAVRESCAAVVALPSGEPVLAAYVVLRDNALDAHDPVADGDQEEARERAEDAVARAVTDLARTRLPDYMVPAAVRVLPSLPLGLSGKLDRKALPAPFVAAGPRTAVAPRTVLERELLRLWSTMLGTDDLGIDDDFFRMGGHSLLAVRMLSAVARSVGVRLPLAAVFRSPTIRGLAAEIEAVDIGTRGATDAPIEPVDRAPRRRALARLDDPAVLAEALAGQGVPDEHADATVFPLSRAQQRMWFLDNLESGRPIYTVRRSYRVSGAVDADRLQAALDVVVGRHDSLRTVVRDRGEVLAAVVLDRAAWPLAVVDLTGEVDPELAVREHARQVAALPWDLDTGPLATAYLYRMGDEDAVLVLRLHHLLLDGWGLDVLISELRAVYDALGSGAHAHLAQSLQYPDYVVWQERHLDDAVIEADLDYWRERMAGAPAALEIPTDRPRPPRPTSAGHRISLPLGPTLTEDVRALARAHGATPFAVLFAGCAALLARLCGQDDIVLGSSVAGRQRAEVEQTVGLFVNTLLLRTDTSGDPRFLDLLAQCHDTVAAAQDHDDLPFERLVEELSPERDLGRNPLFQVMLNLVPAQLDDVVLGEAALIPFDLESPFTRFDLGFTFTERPTGLTAIVEYRSDLFEPDTIERLLARLEALLRVATSQPEARLHELPLLTSGEERTVLDWGTNHTQAAPTTAVDLIAAQVGRFGERPAVLSPGHEDLTYAELWRRSGALARRILADVEPGSTVGVLVGRHPGLLVAALGVWRAGCAFLPLDEAHPAERRSYSLNDAGAHLVLEDADLEGLDTEPVVDAAELPAVSPDSLAYVIYTSGSTGRPKGVEIEHRSLANLLQGMAESVAFSEQDRFAAVTTFSFDIAMLEVFLPVVTGASVVMLDAETAGDARRLADALRAYDVTVLQATPSRWRMLLSDGWQGEATLRALCGGEAISPDLADALRPLVAELWNCYGPTETTIWSTLRRLEEPGDVSIGRPIQDTTVYVLDPRRRLVPPGTTGELWIGGGGVARGYHDRPELTDERFVPDPWQPGRRMYATGDLAVWTTDGHLRCLGRTDSQVKLRGYRIELGEIESVITEQPQVSEAAVLLREDHPGDPRIVAYVVGAADGVLDAVRAALPAYMVPSAVVEMDTMPRTTSNKIDRRALPAPVLDRTEGTPPTSRAQLGVAQVWAELLHVEAPFLEDDFFDLGGHSLLATRLTSRLAEAFGARVELRTVFEHPTLGALAAAMPAAPDERGSGPVPVSRDGRWLDESELSDHEALAAALEGRSGRDSGEVLLWPLSTSQKRMWLLHELAPQDPRYNVTLLRRLRGPVDIEALRTAVDGLAERHELLRSTYVQVDDLLAQVVRPPAGARPGFAVVDAQGLSWDDVLDGVRADGARPFDLTAGAVLRVTLTQVADDDWLLLGAVHHIAMDGWSISRLLRDLADLYAGHDPAAPSLQFGDYVVWEEGRADDGVSAAYWADTLAGAPEETTFPASVERDPNAVPQGRRIRRSLDPALVAGVEDLARAHHATPFMVLTAAVSALLARHGAGPDVVIGTPVATRAFAGGEDLIGALINTVPLRVPVDEADGFGAHLDAAAQVCRGAQANADYPFERLVSDLRIPRSVSRHPVFQVAVSLQEFPAGETAFGAAGLVPVEIDWAAVRFDVAFSWSTAPGRIELVMEYRHDLYADPVGAWLVERFTTFLARAVAEPEVPMSSLPVHGAGEAEAVAAWRHGVELSDLPGLPALVRDVAARQPDLTAVEVGEVRLSYAQLVRAADVLAARLADSGVRAGDVVALCTGHDLTWPVGAFAVWRLGAHFVPVDPGYPTARQQLMLEDSGSVAVVVSPGHAVPEAAQGPAVVVADVATDAGRAAPDLPFPPAGDPEHRDDLAYLIYTSGSTGRPKATRIGHRGLAALTHGLAARVWDGQDPTGVRVGANAPISFDASVQQLSHLGLGATLVPVPDAVRLDPPAFVDFVVDRQLDLLDGTPTHVRMLLEAGLLEKARLSAMLIGGEAIAPDLWDTLRAAEVTSWNMYGPTEVTVDSLVANLGQHAQPTIGWPLPGVRLRVVDAGGRDLPVLGTGELVLGGPQVAEGYLGRPELTAERFVTDADGRWYATGDLVRVHPDGHVDFVGRVDEQVKIRGFRVEPGEVAQALRELEGVQDAAVVAENGELVGFVVVAPGSDWDPVGTRHELRTRLPAHLVPPTLAAVPLIPMTPSGKVDRSALLALPGDRSRGSNEGRAPAGPAEELVAEMWAELLEVDSVSAEDDFFDLGGDSLSASRFVARLRALDIDLPLMIVFTHPTVAALAGPITDLLLGPLDDSWDGSDG